MFLKWLNQLSKIRLCSVIELGSLAFSSKLSNIMPTTDPTDVAATSYADLVIIGAGPAGLMAAVSVSSIADLGSQHDSMDSCMFQS